MITIHVSSRKTCCCDCFGIHTKSMSSVRFSKIDIPRSFCICNISLTEACVLSAINLIPVKKAVLHFTLYANLDDVIPLKHSRYRTLYVFV